MGANTFSTFASGKTPEAAYTAACDEARAYSGHQDGYSGDIQTTRGFVMVEVPPRTRDAGRRKIIAEILKNPANKYSIDKWGPCGCIDLGRTKGMPRGHRNYVFFGWGAS